MSYNPLDTYGYDTGGQGIISQKTQEEQKQSFVDEEQDVEIARNTEINEEQQVQIDANTTINETQQTQIDANTAINEKQDQDIENLYELIKSIPSSGGTITDLDCGTW